MNLDNGGLADVVSLLLILLVVLLGVSAFWLSVYTLAPKFSERSLRRWQLPELELAVGVILGLAVVWGHKFYDWPIFIAEPDFGWNEIGEEPLAGLWEVSFIFLQHLMLLLAFAGFTGLALRIGFGLRTLRDERKTWISAMRGCLILGASLMAIFFYSKFYLHFLYWIGLVSCVLAMFPIQSFGGVRNVRPNRSAAPQRVEGVVPERKPRAPRRERRPRSGEQRTESPGKDT